MSRPEPIKTTETKNGESKAPTKGAGKTVERTANALTEAELGLASGGSSSGAPPVFCANGPH